MGAPLGHLTAGGRHVAHPVTGTAPQRTAGTVAVVEATGSEA